jgi:hypothetical protein
MPAEPIVAYLARGQLFVLRDGESKPVESRFAEDYKSRARSIKRKTDWKRGGTGSRFMGGGSMLWGEDFDLDAIPVQFAGVALGQSPNELLYTLSTGVVGGVFALDLESWQEKRIFHSAEHRLEQIATSPDHGVIAAVMRSRDGTTSLAVMPADGSELHSVTEGDSIDLHPTWLPAGATDDERRHQLVFQSAGIGRSAEGAFVAVGPAGVNLLDPEHGEMQTLREDEHFDFLSPEMDADRRLWVIRRKHDDPSRPPSPFRVLLDALLFPFRLLFALASYLNVFTLRYTGKPLLTSGNARQRSRDMRQMMMMGNLAAAREQADEQAERELDEALGGWQLVRFEEKGGEAEVVDKSVRAFSLLPDGRVVVTNGRRIEVLDGGKRSRLGQDVGITELVAWLPEP